MKVGDMAIQRRAGRNSAPVLIVGRAMRAWWYCLHPDGTVRMWPEGQLREVKDS